jgi:hypothetical protein
MAGTPANALNISTDGIVSSNLGQFSTSTISQYGTLVAGANQAVVSISPGTTGQVLVSNGNAANPSFQTVSASGITTLSTDSGSATGATVNVLAGVSTQNCGSSVQFTGATDTVQFDVTDALTNTIVGKGAGNATLSGSSNTVFGASAGAALTTGSHNCFVGVSAGATTSTQDSNIYLNTSGNPEANTLRIGSGTGTGPKELTQAFISGINGNALGSPKMVTIHPITDQLGVADIPAGGSGFTSVVMQSFTSSGTYTPTAGMAYVIVECQGSGGGGGSNATTTGTGSLSVGGGGGAGAYARNVFSAATVGASQTVTVGAAGLGGTAGNDGGSGNTSSFGSLLSAGGGGGGSAGPAITTTSSVVPGGFGSTTFSGESFGISGGDGGTGFTLIGAGNNISGFGGASYFGGGGRAANGNSAGFTKALGAGGSGGSGNGGGGGQTIGGGGGAGIVIVTEFIA